MVADSEQPGVVALCFLALAGEMGSARRPRERVESVWRNAQRGFEGHKRLDRLLRFQEHFSQQFASRQDDPRSNGVLVSSIFVVGGGTHLAQCFLLLALRPRQPCCYSLPLNIQLLGPVFLIRLEQRVAKRRKLLQTVSRSLGAADPGSAQRSRKMDICFGPGIPPAGE